MFHRPARHLAALLGLVWWALPASVVAATPNIVVILADDLGWGDLRCYNPESKVPTPHLDRLAAEGVRFTDAHSPSAVCSPTRYGLLTGRYAWRTRLKNGVLWGYSPPLIEDSRPTLASFLKAHGYATACVGKWHLGLGFAMTPQADFGDHEKPKSDPSQIDWSRPLTAGPHTVGFETFFGIPASLDMVPYVYIERDRAVSAPSARLAGSRHQRQGGEGFWREGPAIPDFSMEGCLPTLAGKAVGFIRQQTRRRPFFLYFPLTAPHDPWVPTAEFRGKSGCGPRGDFVAQVDAVVGEVMAALSDGGMERNTLLMFTSDNGAHWLPREVESTGHAANGPWRGMKSDAWEGGHRVPLIARWPGRARPGTVSDALVGLNDLFATFADILGKRVPTGAAEDSVSFLRALRGRRHQPRPPLVLHSIRGDFAVREASWKFIDARGSGGWSGGQVETPGQLYDLSVDPGETRNLWESEEGRVARMAEALRKTKLAHSPEERDQEGQ